ncbi:GNAT family N-acetyltransferase [Nocardiopsis sp. NPDC006198]|uniref:GNAT family N-acetyltransferase n=1 Tax=Nocardiopsis sp. NPDC006198 TaxID=3154472 RepID=UPI0033AE2C63
MHIRQAGADDVAASAAILAEAFEDDPLLHDFVPAGPDRRSRLALLFGALMRKGALRHGAVDVAEVPGEGIVGVAVWEGPGRAPGAGWATLREACTLVRAMGVRGLVSSRPVLRAFARHRPERAHWYLDQIGVSAAGRGRGVGGALLAHGLERADREGLPAYLVSSTEHNRRLYRRHGFGDGEIVAGARGAVPMAMLREPGSVAPA